MPPQWCLPGVVHMRPSLNVQCTQQRLGVCGRLFFQTRAERFGNLCNIYLQAYSFSRQRIQGRCSVCGHGMYAAMHSYREAESSPPSGSNSTYVSSGMHASLPTMCVHRTSRCDNSSTSTL